MDEPMDRLVFATIPNTAYGYLQPIQTSSGDGFVSAQEKVGMDRVGDLTMTMKTGGRCSDWRKSQRQWWGSQRCS
jgi:hypothetical protein